MTDPRAVSAQLPGQEGARRVTKNGTGGIGRRDPAADHELLRAPAHHLPGGEAGLAEVCID
jgi:hypothetical protein